MKLNNERNKLPYFALESLRPSSNFPDSERCKLISRSQTWSVTDLNTVFINVLMEKSESKAATGAKMSPSQNTGDAISICDIPAIFAANGKLGQK